MVARDAGVAPETVGPVGADASAAVEPGPDESAAMEACLGHRLDLPSGEAMSACCRLQGTVGARALEALARRCDAGDTPACTIAGMLASGAIAADFAAIAMPTSCRSGICVSELCSNDRFQLRGAARDPARARSLWARGCARGSVDACLLEALDRREDGGCGSETELAHACDLGSGYACGSMISLRLRGEPERAAAVLQGLGLACDAGDLLACSNRATLRMLMSPGPVTTAATAAAMGRACDPAPDDGGDPSDEPARTRFACTALLHFAVREPAAARRVPAAVRRAAAAAARACDADDVEACWTLAQAHERGVGVARDPRRARAIRASACERAPDHEGCPATR